MVERNSKMIVVSGGSSGSGSGFCEQCSKYKAEILKFENTV